MNGFFFFGLLFFFLEIFTFMYYVNKETDDVIGAFTKTVKCSIKNILKQCSLSLAQEMYITKETK